MRFKFSTLLSVATISLAGCVGPQQRPPANAVPAKPPHAFSPIAFKYDPKSAEALNFSRQLDLPAWQCDLEATAGRTMVRYAGAQKIAEYNNSLNECIKHSRTQGEEAIARLKAAKIPAKQLELSKDLYAKWSTYLLSMSPYSQTDVRAKTAYQSAKAALATEVKFSN